MFIENADEIGLTRAQAADFEALTVKAHAAVISQQEAEQALDTRQP